MGDMIYGGGEQRRTYYSGSTCETLDHMMLRAAKSESSDLVSELQANQRLTVTGEEEEGDTYYDCGGGNWWVPVEYVFLDQTLRGWVAMTCVFQVQ